MCSRLLKQYIQLCVASEGINVLSAGGVFVFCSLWRRIWEETQEGLSMLSLVNSEFVFPVFHHRLERLHKDRLYSNHLSEISFALGILSWLFLSQCCCLRQISSEKKFSTLNKHCETSDKLWSRAHQPFVAFYPVIEYARHADIYFVGIMIPINSSNMGLSKVTSVTDSYSICH